MLRTLLQGLVLGFSVAAPVGAIGVLCIRRTLADGWRVGLGCGLGAATADMLYGLVAGLGLSAVAGALASATGVLRAVGCVYLVWLGARTWRAVPATEAARVTGGGRALSAWAQTTLLTLTNPATILSFAAIFSALNPVPAGPLPLVVGVFVGSAAWWLFLATAVSLLRGRITPVHLRWVNRAAGVLLIAFAIRAAWA